MSANEAALAMRSAIQKVATGPEYSKDLSYEESLAAMEYVLQDAADPVQAAVFFIALRMKRETMDEFKGILQALKNSTDIVEAPVDELLDIADPYDGYTRGLPVSAFLPATLAATGLPTFIQGLNEVGPKLGVTPYKIFKAVGKRVDMRSSEAAEQLGNPDAGWAYLDQSKFCKPLHDLLPLRSRIIKRQALTTVEVLQRPLVGRKATHLLTGFVHKAYPPIYSELARFSGFDSAMIVRGVEGGVIPSLQQEGKLFSFHDKGEEQQRPLDPKSLGIEQSTRAVPLPKDLPQVEQADNIANPFDADAAAERAAQAGMAALKGEKGPAYDSLVYAGAITLSHLGRADSLEAGAEMIRKVLDNGQALAHFEAGK
ncbi:MAG: anthranilate phosphoribosyltransferase [Gammaproteobacteria bacterium]